MGRWLLALAAGATLFAQPVSGQDRSIALLQELSDAPGPPGFEEAVRKVMVREMRPLSDSLRYDGLGSVIATQGASGPRVMIDAHMDELGGMVRRVTPDGFMSMQMLGGWLDQALPGQRWIIIGSKGPVRAVTGIRDVHVVPAEDRAKPFARESIFLDAGAKTASELAALGVQVGDPVVPDSQFAELNGTGAYVGKAFDDRVGCAVLLAAMQRTAHARHPNQLLYVATVQEEVGLRGAQTAAVIAKPDVAISLEGGVAGDAPGSRPEETQARLGAGPGIFLFDTSALPNRRMVALVRETARTKGIPLQADLVQGYGDDSAELQRANGGVPTVNLVVPVRYTHAHNGVMTRADFDRTVDLVVALLERLDAAEVARLRDFEPH
jgi:putative aminopeptidase FrvX